MTTTPTTYREAQEILSRHAQTLRNQQEPNIDDLLTIVRESAAAYKVARARIDAVATELEQTLRDPELASGLGGGAS
jgi:exodeoxyribonuclease VII small subunit